MVVSIILDERTTIDTDICAENLNLSYERKIWEISWEPPNNIGKYLSNSLKSNRNKINFIDNRMILVHLTFNLIRQ